MKTILGLSFFGLSTILSAGLIQPADIGLYNTGVDASGDQVTVNGTPEVHWTVDGSGAFVYKNSRYFTDPDNAANWISKYPNGGNEGSIAVPVASSFEISFDLTGYHASTASIAGLWATDNFGEILLNGASTGVSLAAGDIHSNYQNAHGFSLTSGFVNGWNTLTVELKNEGGPGALFVKFTEVSATPVPESSALLSALTVGSLGLLFVRRRRR